MKSKILLTLLCFSTSLSAQKTNCAQIIQQKEQEFGIPKGLLLSIAQVESTMNPYAINALGRSFIAKNKDHAIRIIKSLQSKNVRNIAVGCMQINLTSHGMKFKSLNHILEPEANITYAAKLMKSLYTRFGAWDNAIGFYHASHRTHRKKYCNKVFNVWHGKKHLRIGISPTAGVGAKLDTE